MSIRSQFLAGRALPDHLACILQVTIRIVAKIARQSIHRKSQLHWRLPSHLISNPLQSLPLPLLRKPIPVRNIITSPVPRTTIHGRIKSRLNNRRIPIVMRMFHIRRDPTM